jgi:hypothetical protein
MTMQCAELKDDSKSLFPNQGLQDETPLEQPETPWGYDAVWCED